VHVERFRGPEAPGEGAFHVGGGPGEVAHGQVAPRQGVAGRARHHVGRAFDVGLQLRHAPSDLGHLLLDVVGREKVGIAHECFVPFRLLPEALGPPGLGRGGAPGLDVDRHQGQHGGQGGSGHGHERLVLAGELAQLVGEGGRMGQDGLALLEPPQVLGQGQGGGVAPPGLLLHALLDDGRQVPGKGRDGFAQGDGRLLQGGLEPGQARPSREGRLAGQEGVEGGAHGVDVGGDAHLVFQPRGLLGGHEAGGADHQALLGEPRALQGPGQAEIQDVGLQAPLVLLDHDVGGLEVPVHEALAVGGVDGGGHGLHHGGEVLQAEVLPRGGQGPALDQLHGDEGLAVQLAHLIDLADVGMVDLGLVLGFQDEAAHAPRVVPGEELQGDLPLEDEVEGPVDPPHPALAQELEVRVVGPGRGLDGEGARVVPEEGGPRTEVRGRFRTPDGRLAFPHVLPLCVHVPFR